MRRTLSLQGPEARVVAEAYHGGCPGRGADAQLVLRFRRLRPDSDVVVLERTAVTQLKWLSADRLLVGYASESPGQEREQLVRVADDSVRLILRGTRRLGRFTPPGA